MNNTLSYLLFMTLRMSTPIGLTALGGVISQKAGINNIGMEGIMVGGAFLGVVGSYITGNPWIGVLLAMVGGILVSAIHSFITITCGGDQSVSSMSLVILSNGAAIVALYAIFGQSGHTAEVTNLGTSEIFRNVSDFFYKLPPFVYIGLFSAFAIHYVFYHTPIGMHIIACGENPMAAETAGINVTAVRYGAVIISGLYGGLGGAHIALGQLNMFQDGMIGGRGYIALAAVIMGKWTPLGTYGAAVFFGFFEALQMYIQMQPEFPVPTEFISMIPYLSCMVMLAATAKKRTDSPLSLGKPFSRISGTR